MLLCIMHLILANSCLTGIIFYYIERAIVVKFSTDRSDYEYILKKIQTGSVTSTSHTISFMYEKGARSTALGVIFNHKVTLHHKK